MKQTRQKFEEEASLEVEMVEGCISGWCINSRVLEPLHSRASLQVLFDLGRVFAVETLRLLVELGVPLVDVVDVGVVVVGPASAVLGPLLDPAKWQRRVRQSFVESPIL